ncbi:hypothetical protein HanPI659440_Chr15g0596451 [Helianthus annuus]|nr:hypothetical protein HanPI659440_Chr15g0596451 [Helianthus annuus]
MSTHVLGLDEINMAEGMFYILLNVNLLSYYLHIGNVYELLWSRNEGLIVRVLVAPLLGLCSMVGLLMNLGVTKLFSVVFSLRSLMLQRVFTTRVLKLKLSFGYVLKRTIKGQKLS